MDTFAQNCILSEYPEPNIHRFSMCVFIPINFNIAKFKATGTIYFFFFCVVGIDFKIKTVELQGKKIKLQIW